MSRGRLSAPPASRDPVSVRTGSRKPQRGDRVERRTILDSFPSVFAPVKPPAEPERAEPIQEEIPAPEFPEQSDVAIPTVSVSPEVVEIERVLDTTENDAPVYDPEPKSFSRPVEIEPDWHQLRRRCEVCGHDRQGDLDPMRSPRYILDQDWVICRSCYSVLRETERDGYEGSASGYVLPYDFLERKMRRLGRHRNSYCVDCRPGGPIALPCPELFRETIRLKDLYERPALQAQDLTCYGCLEAIGDIEWALQLLLYHLAAHGVIRIHLLQAPFVSSPKNVGAWVEENQLELRQMPSEKGLESLLRRLGLEIRVRIPSVNVPIGRPTPSYVAGSVWNPWNAFQIAKLGFASVMNCGFGEELVLSRKGASPAAELLAYPRRPFGKVT